MKNDYIYLGLAVSIVAVFMMTFQGLATTIGKYVQIISLGIGFCMMVYGFAYQEDVRKSQSKERGE